MGAVIHLVERIVSESLTTSGSSHSCRGHNLDYVHSMALMLRGMGHEVDFAINGTAALEEARRFRDTVQ